MIFFFFNKIHLTVLGLNPKTPEQDLPIRPWLPIRDQGLVQSSLVSTLSLENYNSMGNIRYFPYVFDNQFCYINFFIKIPNTNTIR